MKKIYIQYFKTDLGELIVGSFEDALCLCDWRYRKMRSAIDERIQSGLQARYEEGETPTIAATKAQILAYLAGERQDFSIPLHLVGTDFQKAVWQELIQVPFGTTESYLGLSNRLHNPKAIRAVAAANGANAISIIVPCHRIIGSDGALTGYAGGLAAKEKLLKLENIYPKQEQARLF